MSLNVQQLLYVYHGLHHVFREDLHLARPLIQILQKNSKPEKARHLAMEMARRMLAHGHSSSALSFLGICKRLNHPQHGDIESMTSMAQMSLDNPQDSPMETFSLIDKLSDREAMDFILQAKIVRCHDGYNVVRQGEISDSFYLILEGKMKVHLQLSEGSDVHLNTLHPGDYFGEYACVYQLPRTANVTASGEAVILEFSNKAIAQLMEQSPEAGEQLMKAVRTRLIQSMSQTHPAFTQLAAADCDWMAEESAIIELKAGTFLDHQLAQQCCVVMHGELIAQQHDQQRPLCLLQKNDIFGTHSKYLALPEGARFFTENRSLVCCIPENIFLSFMAAYGDFERWIKTARSRHLTTSQAE
ncbi:MAG: cyclic nucleotide-binding domain-containing protein [Mariprofundaceae bacterium]|nr:cyclic nucleotide-binding domain-containing protein [Mariprofundaceae bacterium]